MIPFSPPAILLGVFVATSLARRGVKRKSLSQSGAIAAWFVGFLSVSTGLRGFVLLFFYQIGTWATKYKKSLKEEKDSTASEGAARGASQVLSCSFIAVALSLLRAIYCGKEEPIDFENDPLAASLTCAILSHHACCLADTLASELGILSSVQPVMITQPWRRVPPGTNGGVTVMGFLWSCVGGFLMGLSQILMDRLSGSVPLNVIFTLVYASVCGLVGSILDSFLGATVQATYYDADTKRIYHAGVNRAKTAELVSGIDILNNEQVNLVSVALTTILGGWIIGPWLMTIIR